MKHALLALAALAILAAQAHAAARIEQLRPHRAHPGLCTADRIWCISQSGDTVTVMHNQDRRYENVARLPLPSDQEQRIESRSWPSIVRIALPGQPEFVLVGVERTQREMFSGGGASVTHLTLFEIRPGANGAPRPVLEAPLVGNVMIRACFGPGDERRRRGACHDEYRYNATLFAPAQRANDTRLIYRSRADSFPGRRGRYQDSSRERPLRRGDLFRAVDRACSVERTLIRNPSTGLFAWSAPLPPCGDYLELQ